MRAHTATADVRRIAAITVTVAIALGFLWLFLRYGLGIVMPFFLAWVLSLCLTPIAERIAVRTRFPKKLCAVILLFLAVAVLCTVIGLLANRIFREIEDILSQIAENPQKVEGVKQQIVEYLSKIVRSVPFFSSFGDAELSREIEAAATEWLDGITKRITEAVPPLMLRWISATPKILLFLFVFLISSVYFCVDGVRIGEGMRAWLPKRWSEKLDEIRTHVRGLLSRYVRVYLLLFLLTLAQLFFGLLILGRPYAFLSALCISALDILPVLGVGTVLVPWAILLFLRHEPQTAIGLLVLWGIVTIVRQIAEPRLIGNSFGIHPLFALFALYAGIELFGVVGVIVGPGLAVFLKLILSEIRSARHGTKVSEPS